MKRFILLAASILIIVVGLFIVVRLIAVQKGGKGGLQVTANVKSSAFLDDKKIGTTPLCISPECSPQNELITAGIYTLKVIPEDTTYSPFTAKIEINDGVLTAVDRTFLPGSFSSAYILTLEKTNLSDPQLIITSLPNEALVAIDGSSQGVTPFSIQKISPSEHEVEVQKQGFGKKTVRVRTVPSYKLIVNVILGTYSDDSGTNPTATPQNVTPTVFPIMIKIKNTPTGFLRVRKEPTLDSPEIARVLPDETYSYLDEKDEWFKIQLKDEQEGWVSSSFAEKIEGR